MKNSKPTSSSSSLSPSVPIPSSAASDSLSVPTQQNQQQQQSLSQISQQQLFNQSPPSVQKSKQHSQTIGIQASSSTLPLPLQSPIQSLTTNIDKYLNHRSLLLSTIDQSHSNNNFKHNPQQLRIKNNILIILLVLTVYGLYFLIGNFIDYLLLGYITGLAYHQTRNRFTKFVMDPKTYQSRNQPVYIRLGKALLLTIFILILPRLRYMLNNPQQFLQILNLNNYLKSFQKNTNITVIVCQIASLLLILYILLRPYLKKIGHKVRPRNISCIQIMFGIWVFMFTVAIVAVIPTVLFKEIGQVSFLAEQKIQKFLQCQFITFGQHNNPDLPLCSQKVTQNTLIKHTIQQFRNQNQTVQSCKNYITQFQLDYFGYSVFHYDEIACTWYSIIAKASNYPAIQSQTQQISTASIFSTGTSIFKHIFGNLTSIVISMSNAFFYFTIWLAFFILTVQKTQRQFTLKQIFSQNNQQLIGDITKLIHATCLIVIWHFIASILLLQLFAFTPVNLIISILLSLMAFIPIFRPWFAILFISLLRMLIQKQYVVPIIFIFLYRYVSQEIYSFYYGKLKIHQIIVNFSVLFGIYSFGIAGIIYGPLLVILYTCVQKELLSSYIHGSGNGNGIGVEDKSNNNTNANRIAKILASNGLNSIISHEKQNSFCDQRDLQLLRKRQSQHAIQQKKQQEQRDKNREQEEKIIGKNNLEIPVKLQYMKNMENKKKGKNKTGKQDEGNNQIKQGGKKLSKSKSAKLIKQN